MVFGMPRPYPKEFKQGAIELARRCERPIAVRDLGFPLGRV